MQYSLFYKSQVLQQLNHRPLAGICSKPDIPLFPVPVLNDIADPSHFHQGHTIESADVRHRRAFHVLADRPKSLFQLTGLFLRARACGDRNEGAGLYSGDE